MQDQLQIQTREFGKPEQDQVVIRVSINSDYRAFDLAGKLPLNIVFGLCLHVKPEAPGSRPIVLDVSGSVFDVPYALANGLLILYDKTEKGGRKVDLSEFDAPASESSFLTLQPKVKVSRLYIDKLYTWTLTPESQLAKLLHPNTTYDIRLASSQLGVKWWAYGHPDELLDGGHPTRPSESAILVSTRGTGRGSFKVVKSLPWPPQVEIRMSVQLQSQAVDPVSGHVLYYSVIPTSVDIIFKASSSMLEFSITNMGEDTVVVQSSGHQRFLLHWGPYQPDPGPDDRPRITTTTTTSGSACLVVTDVESGDVRFCYRRPICVLTVGNADRRPKRRDLTVLEPSKTLKKQVDLSRMTAKLPDGVYQVELEAMGVSWFRGNIADLYGSEAPDENERVPRERCATLIPPLWLSCRDTVRICVTDGNWKLPI